MASKSKIITQAQFEKEMSKLLCAVNPLDVFTSDKTGKKLFLNGREITELEMGDLKADAMYFGKSRLWNVLAETIRSQAMEVMFTKSKDFDDMRTGKMMLYNLDIQKKIIKLLENWKK